MRIIFLPVDERFCTRDYCIQMAKSFNLDILTPPRALLGQKKIPADTHAITEWLEETFTQNDILILSLDTLLYGGLIPSRIDLLKEETLIERLEILEKYRRRAKKIYITSTIMRIPKYNSDDEEPVYWEYYGKRIHDMSKMMGRLLQRRINELSSFEDNLYKEVLNSEALSEKDNVIPSWILKDYFNRRIRNARVIQKAFDFVKEGVIDFLNLTLDDNGKNSLNVIEATIHNNYATSLAIKDRFSIHPGADEATLTLLSRAVCNELNQSPLINIHYRHEDKKKLIPPYEGDPLDITVRNHIRAAGGIVSNSDVILFVNNMDNEEWIESPNQPDNLYEHSKLERLLNNSRISGIADIRYPNGSDKDLVKWLCSTKRDWSKMNYAGWNTPSNTLGTNCCLTVFQDLANRGFLQIDKEELSKFQQEMLIEHYGYQAIVRQKLREKSIEKGCTIWTLLPAEQWAEDFSIKQLETYKKMIEQAFEKPFKMEVFFPWHRSFEIGIRLE
ncbi:MAG: DUF4127 family protein [Thermotogota bacterium]